jgi:acyl carrier protein
MMNTNDVKSSVKDYILEEFLPGVDAEELTDDTPLISAGILDSLSTTRLVAFLEDKFTIEVAPHEMGVDYMDTLKDICALVLAKGSLTPA